MSKTKKIILIVIAIILILAIAIGLVWCIGFGNKEEGTTEEKPSQIEKLYSILTEKETYSITTTLDNENTIYYAKKDNKAYNEVTHDGKKTKFMVKDGNSYLIVDDQQVYYTYENNEIDLNKIEAQLENVKDENYREGKEKIEGKKYYYEEYEKVADFLMKDVNSTDEQKIKTRFYFDGDKLVYIKTMVEDYEETLKVDISYDVDSKLFEIPSGYKQA